ncbi:MAG: ABC transporter ATP-binding protein [Planctomycetota bacterium]
MKPVSILQASGLTKRFGSRAAVDGLTLDVAQGEVLGLLGPNGAGKTTTLRMLVGATQPDEGQVAIGSEGGNPLDPETRRRLGLAPQGLSLVPELSGAENVRFMARLQGLTGSGMRERVDWALDFVGLSERSGDLVREYSGGMQRRLNLACAVVHDPDLLLLDEPTVGVDPQSRAHLLSGVAELAKSGKAVLYTTHYMEEAEKLCDRLVVMDGGRALLSGRVPELIEEHGGPARFEATVGGECEDFGFLSSMLEDLVVEKRPAQEGITLHRLAGAARQPEAALSALMKAGVSIDELKIERPDLEDVFLKWTGRSLRDGGGSSETSS